MKIKNKKIIAKVEAVNKQRDIADVAVKVFLKEQGDLFDLIRSNYKEFEDCEFTIDGEKMEVTKEEERKHPIVEAIENIFEEYEKKREI